MAIPPKPRFRGRVTYVPGPGGANQPVAGAKIRIWDDDVSGDDTLVSTTANSAGRFNRRAAKDWQDTKTVRLPFGGRVTTPDPTDLPIFMMSIEDPATGQTMTGPFPYVSDAVEVPLVVPWQGAAPALPEIMNINGTSIRLNDSPDEIWTKIKDLAEAGTAITIRFSDAFPAGAKMPFKNGALDYAAMREIACSMIGIDPNSETLQVNPAVEVLIANVAIIFILFVAAPMAFAASVFLMTLGVAILLAVALGYRVEVEQESGGMTGPMEVLVPMVDLKIKLVPPA